MNKVPIVIAFTENYFVSASTFLTSLLKNSDDTNSFHVICLLTDVLPERLEYKLTKLGGSRCTFEFINLMGKLDGIYVNPRYTIAASYRLLLPEILPQYDKILYMDCDIIVQQDMAKLYNDTSVEGYYLAAVFEAVLEHQIAYIKQLGCNPHYYFNSGVLIFNLQKMRANNMTDKFIDASKKEGLQFPDQDVLNQLCQGHVIGLSPLYNSIRTYFIPSYRSQFIRRYDEKIWIKLQEHSNIHYTGNKPWISFTVKFGTWWKYYNMLPAEIKQEGQISILYYYISLIYNNPLGNYFINGLQAMLRKFKS